MIWAEEILERRGFRDLTVFTVKCDARPGMKSWYFLEKALLAQFRATYFELPCCNKQGRKLKWTRKLGRLFKKSAVDKVLEAFHVGK